MRTLLLAAASALLLAAPAVAGGFATAGLAPPPDGIKAGETWNARITILQHGRTPLDGVSPTLTLIDRNGGAAGAFPATPTGTPGVYLAKVKFPRAGTWRYQVHDGFTQTHTYAPVTVGGGGTGSGLSAPAWAVAIAAVAIALAAVLLLGRRPRAAPAPLAERL